MSSIAGGIILQWWRAGGINLYLGYTNCPRMAQNSAILRQYVYIESGNAININCSSELIHRLKKRGKKIIKDNQDDYFNGLRWSSPKPISKLVILGDPVL
ncbi:unnamed protein product [Blepharisma stoltei]|uniref:Uncharacterized protein n=1 Tax=Blepharisma stoltei TaxID=1481888 RepID=A0AAU9JGV2_9CILI|nr:unnamed protein product [Blepharisma stoltei]